jgi:hypothetical protein
VPGSSVRGPAGEPDTFSLHTGYGRVYAGGRTVTKLLKLLPVLVLAAAATDLFFGSHEVVHWCGVTDLEVQLLVRDAETQVPVEGAAVHVKVLRPGQDVEFRLTTDAAGVASHLLQRYPCSGTSSPYRDSFFVPLPWHLRASAPGYEEVVWPEVVLPEGGGAVRCGPGQSPGRHPHRPHEAAGGPAVRRRLTWTHATDTRCPMTRRRLFLVLTACPVVAGLGAWGVLGLTQEKVTRDNFQRVQIGMTTRQVFDLLGEPASRRPVKGRLLGHNVFREVPDDALRPGDYWRPYDYCQWKGEEYAIDVALDTEGRVAWREGTSRGRFVYPWYEVLLQRLKAACGL